MTSRYRFRLMLAAICTSFEVTVSAARRHAPGAPQARLAR
jgi:hypothetical protein